jgi:hypothetical protein
MDPSTILTSVIEVAIGVAGFSGIVAALSRRNEQMSEEAWHYLTILLSGSATAIFASFLPLILISGGLAEDRVWMYPSALLFGYTLFRNAYLINRARLSTEIKTRPINYVAFSLAVTVMVLCLLNAAIIRAAWPYLTSMVLTVLTAGLAFVALLHVLLRPKHD